MYTVVYEDNFLILNELGPDERFRTQYCARLDATATNVGSAVGARRDGGRHADLGPRRSAPDAVRAPLPVWRRVVGRHQRATAPAWIVVEDQFCSDVRDNARVCRPYQRRSLVAGCVVATCCQWRVHAASSSCSSLAVSLRTPFTRPFITLLFTVRQHFCRPL